MKNFEEIESIWSNQKVNNLPTASQIVEKYKKDKNKLVQKVILQISSRIVAILGMIWVMIRVKTEFMTTQIGLGILFLCIISFVIVGFYQMYHLQSINFLDNPIINLKKLEEYYNLKKRIYSKGLFIYTIALYTGLTLYFIEIVIKTEEKYMLFLMLAIILLVTFFAWKKFTKILSKEQKQLNDWIEELREMKHINKNE